MEQTTTTVRPGNEVHGVALCGKNIKDSLALKNGANNHRLFLCLTHTLLEFQYKIVDTTALVKTSS